MPRPPITQRFPTSSIIQQIVLLNKKSNFLAGLISLSYLVLLSRFQGDPHHDGYILGSSAVVAQGKLPFIGAFSQYGWLTPVIAGLFMKLFGVSVLSLRTLAAITTFAIYLLMGRLLKTLGFGRKQSLLLRIFWVTANHVVSTSFPGAFFFWPSLLSTFFLISSMVLLLEDHEAKNGRTKQFLAGICIALSMFTRLQSGLVMAGVIFFALFGLISRKKAKYAVLGFCISTLLTIIGLAKVGIIKEFYNQSIKWPLSFYSSLGSGNNYNRFQFGLFFSLPLALLIFTKFYSLITRKRKRVEIQALSFLLGITIFFIQLLAGRLLQSNANTILRLLIGDQIDRIVFWPYYFLFLIPFIYISTKFLNNKSKKVEPQKAIVIAYAITTAIQIFPQPDIGHLWWISPVFIAAASLIELRTLRDLLISQLIPILLISSTFLNIRYFSGKWEEYNYKPLKGIYAAPIKAESVSIYKPLEELDYTRTTVFLCHDGLHAVASGRYESFDKYFVDWGPAPVGANKLSREISVDRIVICDQTKENVQKIARESSKKIVYFAEKTNGDTYRSLGVVEAGK